MSVSYPTSSMQIDLKFALIKDSGWGASREEERSRKQGAGRGDRGGRGEGRGERGERTGEGGERGEGRGREGERGDERDKGDFLPQVSPI